MSCWPFDPGPEVIGNATETGAYIVTGNRPPTRAHGKLITGPTRSNLVSVTIARHTEPLGRTLTFGSLNIRSLFPLKLDALLVE